MELTPQDLQQLQLAKQFLQSKSWVTQLSQLIGSPVEKSLTLLPDSLQRSIQSATEKSLFTAMDTAIYTLNDEPGYSASQTLHKISAAATGGIGGFFGASALAIELPVSTTIILRSIADIARSEGESIQSLSTKLACLEVFALGSPSDNDDAAETSYFTIRAGLGSSIADAAQYLTQKGISDKSAPVVIKLMQKIAERFGMQVTQKVAAQAIPAIGAAGGAIINTLFINHFQNIARGHFIIRRLEHLYGKQQIRQAYSALP